MPPWEIGPAPCVPRNKQWLGHTLSARRPACRDAQSKSAGLAQMKREQIDHVRFVLDNQDACGRHLWVALDPELCRHTRCLSKSVRNREGEDVKNYLRASGVAVRVVRLASRSTTT